VGTATSWNGDTMRFAALESGNAIRNPTPCSTTEPGTPLTTPWAAWMSDGPGLYSPNRDEPLRGALRGGVPHFLGASRFQRP